MALYRIPKRWKNELKRKKTNKINSQYFNILFRNKSPNHIPQVRAKTVQHSVHNINDVNETYDRTKNQ